MTRPIAFISRRMKLCLCPRNLQLLWRKPSAWSWLKLELTRISFFVKGVVVPELESRACSCYFCSFAKTANLIGIAAINAGLVYLLNTRNNLLATVTNYP